MAVRKLCSCGLTVAYVTKAHLLSKVHEKAQEIRILLEQRLSVKEIAAKTGVTGNSVRAIAHGFGMAFRSSPRPELKGPSFSHPQDAATIPAGLLPFVEKAATSGLSNFNFALRTNLVPMSKRVYIEGRRCALVKAFEPKDRPEGTFIVHRPFPKDFEFVIVWAGDDWYVVPERSFSPFWTSVRPRGTMKYRSQGDSRSNWDLHLNAWGILKGEQQNEAG